MAQLKITYTKSVIGYSKDQKATVKSLGLRRLNQSVLHNDTPVIRGMAFKVRHLVTVEEVNDETVRTRTASVYETPAATSNRSSGSEQ
jgi:large subunit ribosomal protein L30